MGSHRQNSFKQLRQNWTKYQKMGEGDAILTMKQIQMRRKYTMQQLNVLNAKTVAPQAPNKSSTTTTQKSSPKISAPQRASAAQAPLLTQTHSTSEADRLKGHISRRIHHMEEMLAEQDSLAGQSRKAERLSDLMGPAMRSVIRGRERMLRCLQDNTFI
jgi:hypothetical protein